MKITNKIRLSVIVPALFSVIMGITGVRGFLEINHQVETIYDDRIIPLKELKEISDNYAVYIIDAVNKVDSGIITPSQALDQILQAQNNIEKQWDSYRQSYLTPQETKLAQEAERLFQEVDQQIPLLIRALESNDQETITRLDGELYEVIDPLTNKIQELINLQLEIAQVERGKAAVIFRSVVEFYSVLIILTSAVVIFSLLLTVQLKKQMQKMIEAAEYSSVQVTSSSTQISASGKQLETTMNEQVSATTSVTATSQEISTNSKNLVITMEEVVTQIEDTAEEANEGQNNLAQMESTMMQLLDATTSIASRLGVMSEKAHNISNIVVTITKVADQTNLLSLNAAIEAEKAGEHGAGFSVVAREIRRLADQTAIATLEIEDIVSEMQSAVSMGVMEMDKFSTEVKGNVRDVQIISEQIVKIISQVQTLTPRFVMVSGSMEEQAQGAEQITGSMDELRVVSQQTVSSLQETNSALDNLNQAAQTLRQAILNFQVSI